MENVERIDISVIVVSYNTKDFLRECLHLLEKYIPKSLSSEVIVVDNASSDESVGMVRKDFPQILLIENKENVGFSKANNRAVKHAKGKYILFLNSDTAVTKDSIGRMVEFMQDTSDAGAATCYIKLPTGKIDDASHRGFPTPWRAFCHFSGLSNIFPKSQLFNGYHLGWKNLSETHEIEALAGAFILVRRIAGDEVGWWDEDYFFYGEDIDFCYKLIENGWKIYFVPDAIVLHHKGISSGIKKHSEQKSTASLETKRFVTNQRFNAMKIFYKKHYMKKYPKILTAFVMKAIDVKLWTTTRTLK